MMTQPAPTSSTANWLLSTFVRNTDGVADAVAVSSEGLLMAMSEGLHTSGAQQMAAIVSGVTGLARSTSRRYGLEGLKLVMIEMHRGFLLVSAISDGSCLGVITTSLCDIGLVGHEMSTLCHRFGALLTPQFVSEFQEEALR